MSEQTGQVSIVKVENHSAGKQLSVPRKKSDELLKGAFQDNFFDFLRFVYPEAEDDVDFSKGVDFMDKELFF